MRRFGGCLLAVLLCLSISGCGASESKSESTAAPDQFETLVSEADAALATGDAKGAFDLYSDALKIPEASDPDGSVAERRDHAKSLHLARALIAKGASATDPKNSVTIIVEYSDAETETVEAKRRVIAFLQERADSMRADIPDLRSTIEAEREFKIPAGIYMAGAMSEMYLKLFERMEGDFGEQTVAATGLLARAAGEAKMVMEHEWVDECVADLNKAESTLDELDAHLEGMRDSL